MTNCNYGSKYAVYHTKSEPGYKVAIDYYKAQKENFKAWIKQQSGAVAAESIMALTDTMNQQLQSDNVLNSIGEKSKKYFQQLEQQIIAFLSSTENANVLSAMGNLQAELNTLYPVSNGKSAKIDGKTIVDKVRPLLDNIISIDIMQNELNKILQSELKKNLSQLTKNELQMVYGFSRRVIYNQLKSNHLQSASVSGKALSGYISGFKGYFKEDVLILLLNQYCKENNISAKARLSGEKKNQSGKEISTDIFLGNRRGSVQKSANLAEQLDRYLMSPLSHRLDQFSQNQDTRLLINLFDPKDFIGAGMQSKSWPMPAFVQEHNSKMSASKQLRPYYEIGSRAQFQPLASVQTSEGFGVYAWHYNVYALSRNVIPLLGAANILYSTGSGTLWTYELIQQFREQNYYLSFYFHHRGGKWQRPASADVSWQQEVPSDKFKGFKK